MQIEFDETSIESVQDALSKLHKFRTKLTRDNPDARISNVRWSKRLAALKRERECIDSIANADLSSIFLPGDGEHYVYAHCSPSSVLNVKENARHLFAAELGMTHVPFYIGKGIGERADDLTRNEGHRKIRQHLLKEGKDVQVFKIKTGMSEDAAFGLEGKLIDIFALKYLCKYGMLVNLDEGMFSKERRSKYPKGAGWYLNKMKIQPHGVPKG